MRRLVVAIAVVAFGGNAVAAEVRLAKKKPDALVEVQQVPLESFGTPADVRNLDRWSTWLVRITNRCKYPVFVQRPAGPGSSVSADEIRVRHADPAEWHMGSAALSHKNWYLEDGKGRIVGRARDTVYLRLPGEPDRSVPAGPAEFAAPPPDPERILGVFDYLLREKAPLADPEYALQAPPRRQTLALCKALGMMYHGERAAADALLTRAANQPQYEPIVFVPKLTPCPGLWPGETTWGYLVFWRHQETGSKKIVPRPNLGKGTTWFRVENPKLLDELTEPAE